MDAGKSLDGQPQQEGQCEDRGAIGITNDGFREILGICEGAKETKSGWSSFLRHLVDRGLKDVELVISDACRRLVESVTEYRPQARWPRCVVPGYRNVFSHVPAGKRIASGRPRPNAPSGPNQVWSYDFVFDGCANGQKLKCRTVSDEWTKQGLAIEVDGRIRSRRLIEVLSRLVYERGEPRYLIPNALACDLRPRA